MLSKETVIEIQEKFEKLTAEMSFLKGYLKGCILAENNYYADVRNFKVIKGGLCERNDIDKSC